MAVKKIAVSAGGLVQIEHGGRLLEVLLFESEAPARYHVGKHMVFGLSEHWEEFDGLGQPLGIVRREFETLFDMGRGATAPGVLRNDGLRNALRNSLRAPLCTARRWGGCQGCEYRVRCWQLQIEHGLMEMYLEVAVDALAEICSSPSHLHSDSNWWQVMEGFSSSGVVVKLEVHPSWAKDPEAFRIRTVHRRAVTGRYRPSSHFDRCSSFFPHTPTWRAADTCSWEPDDCLACPRPPDSGLRCLAERRR